MKNSDLDLVMLKLMLFGFALFIFIVIIIIITRFWVDGRRREVGGGGSGDGRYGSPPRGISVFLPTATLIAIPHCQSFKLYLQLNEGFSQSTEAYIIIIHVCYCIVF